MLLFHMWEMNGTLKNIQLTLEGGSLTLRLVFMNELFLSYQLSHCYILGTQRYYL